MNLQNLSLHFYFLSLIFSFLFSNISVYALFQCIANSSAIFQLFLNWRCFEIVRGNKIQLIQLYAIHHTLHMVQHQILQNREETELEFNNTCTCTDVTWRLRYFLHKVRNTVLPGMSNDWAVYTQHFIFGTYELLLCCVPAHSASNTGVGDKKETLVKKTLNESQEVSVLFLSAEYYSLYLKILGDFETRGQIRNSHQLPPLVFLSSLFFAL